MKKKFDIEIDNSSKISGGYLCTTAPMTKRQVQKEMERIGRELIKNSYGDITSVSYTAWEQNWEDASIEDIESGKIISAYVSLRKYGRRIEVFAC